MPSSVDHLRPEGPLNGLHGLGELRVVVRGDGLDHGRGRGHRPGRKLRALVGQAVLPRERVYPTIDRWFNKCIYLYSCDLS